MSATVEVVVPDSDGRGFLKFEYAQDNDYWVSIQFEGASARVRQGNYAGGDGLPHFFASMAKDWKGWKKVRRWKSPMGGLELDAEHDGRSKVLLTVKLGPYSKPWVWNLEATLDVAPGELEGIAADLNDLFEPR